MAIESGRSPARKVAVVTGASRGLGRALAERLGARGWALVVDARHATALEESASALRSKGIEVAALAGDVTDAGHRAALAEAADALGGAGLVVHNAGTLGPSPLPPLGDLEPDDLRSLFEANVVAPLALWQQLLPQLRRRRGTVVAVTSDAAVEGYERWGGYGASKAALEQLHHVLGTEHPELRVYRFDPGDMRTQMHQDAFVGEDISDRPGPAEAAEALCRLLDLAPPSGRYRGSEMAAETPTVPV